jgi:phospholipase/lecithinase/hemolysin
MKTTVTASHIRQPQTERIPSARNPRPAWQRLRQWALVAVALTLFPAASARAGAAMGDGRHVSDSQPFSRIFVFGDSLSDTGNLFRLSGGYPPPPYFEGRFSNGHLWVEQLADALGMSITPGDNYAVGGATTGHFNSNDGVNGQVYPGLLDEIASFKATRSAAEAQGALFVVWAGANDFFVALVTGQDPEVLIGDGVGNTVQAIQQLYQSGARHIMVVNMPDLGLTPYALGMNVGAPVTQLSVAYDHVLDSALDSLASAGIPTIRVDAFATLRKMVAQPAQFGFTNVTDPLISFGGAAPGYLFWDSVHPTTEGHAVFAEVAVDSLISYFSPRQGKGSPPARINALNGLVNAWDNN